MAFTVIPCRLAYNRRTGGLVIGWVNFIFYIVALISFYIYKHPKSTDESKATFNRNNHKGSVESAKW